MKQANANEALADGSEEKGKREEGRERERRREKERDINDTHFPHSANEIINKQSLLHTLSFSMSLSFPCVSLLIPHRSLSELCRGKRILITAVSFPHCVHYQQTVFNARRRPSLLYHSICCWELHSQAKPRLPSSVPPHPTTLLGGRCVGA